MSVTAGIEPGGMREFVRRARTSRSLVVGLTLTLVVIAMALISFLWTPYDVTRLIISDKMLPVSPQHVLGTDHFGRDILSSPSLPCSRQ